MFSAPHLMARKQRENFCLSDGCAWLVTCIFISGLDQVCAGWNGV